MSKTKEELNALKEEVEAVNEKLAELTPEEIAQVMAAVSSSAAITSLCPASTRWGSTLIE